MQLKLTELVEKFDVLLKNQVSANERLEELTAIPRPSPSNFTFPIGCVRIRSVLANKYLFVSSTFDSKRRKLSLYIDYDRWILFREADYYRITRRQNQEDLYVAGDQTYDAQRRRIFTWIVGFREDEGKWEIVEAYHFPGMVHIRSKHYGEYLFAEDDNVFTWIPKWSPAKDAKYLWQIEEC
ncbi:uncharacterized protein LOC119765360 [Culex quinquefasciatus]|uniref:uncharacterized protein LOC119765360 n=1 Tax=Culex quinquefasciatus TaxID=7176 RepID=UPI0018E33ABA|nr:uncharacterized protein LOC119765360 [Culex quinquefasciatus]